MDVRVWKDRGYTVEYIFNEFFRILPLEGLRLLGDEQLKLRVRFVFEYFVLSVMVEKDFRGISRCMGRRRGVAIRP